jgi:hypothetical protein
MARHRDGIDEHPTVHAADFKEALSLGGEGVSYLCDDGAIVSYGGKVALLYLGYPSRSGVC